MPNKRKHYLICLSERDILNLYLGITLKYKILKFQNSTFSQLFLLFSYSEFQTAHVNKCKKHFSHNFGTEGRWCLPTVISTQILTNCVLCTTEPCIKKEGPRTRKIQLEMAKGLWTLIENDMSSSEVLLPY